MLNTFSVKCIRFCDKLQFNGALHRRGEQLKPTQTGRRGRRPLRPRNRSKSFYGNKLANVLDRRGRRPRRPVNERFKLTKWRVFAFFKHTYKSKFEHHPQKKHRRAVRLSDIFSVKLKEINLWKGLP